MYFGHRHPLYYIFSPPSFFFHLPVGPSVKRHFNLKSFPPLFRPTGCYLKRISLSLYLSLFSLKRIYFNSRYVSEFIVEIQAKIKSQRKMKMSWYQKEKKKV
jgi:hypothetical protein